MDRKRPVSVSSALIGVSLILLGVLFLLRPARLPAPPRPTTTPDPTTHSLLWEFDNARKYYAPLPPPVARPGGGLLIIAEGQPNGRITLAQAYSPAGQLAWSYTAGSTITALIPVLPDGFFLGAADPDNRIHALDDSGAVRWRFAAGASILHLALADARQDHIRLGARLLGEEVVLLDGAGQQLWRQTVPGILAGPEPVGTDLVAVGALPNRVQALRIADGAPAWDHTLPGDLGALAPDPAGLLATYAGGVLALDPAGQVRWRWERPGVRFGLILAAATGFYTLGNAEPDKLVLYRLDRAGTLLHTTPLPGRLADARLFTAPGDASAGVYVQIGRRFYHAASCGLLTPLTLPQAPALDGFLPWQGRTFIAADDRLFALAGATWGQSCP